MTTVSTTNPAAENTAAPQKTAAGARKPVPFRQKLKKQTAIVSRWLHIYLSMVSFGVVLFFAVTGLTLNHAEAFGAKEKTSRLTGQMQQGWLKPANNAEPARLEIVEYLRSTNKLHGAVSDLRVDDDQITVSFKAPGYMADAAIDRSTGRYDVIEVRNGFVAVINDLHKGRDAGKVWSLVIDASAILLTLVSFSGLLLLFFVYKRRASGLILAAIGCIVCYLVYLRFVP